MEKEVLHVKVPLTGAIGDYLVELFMMVTPHDPFSCKLKRILLRWRGATVGRRPKVWRDVWIDDYRKLTIGSDVSIGKSAMLLTHGGVTIGDEVMIAHGARIISAGHRIPEAGSTMRFSGLEVAPITIDDGAWIGAGAIVLPGVRVGRGSIVAAGAVVTRDVEPGTIVAGVPGDAIGRRS